MKLMKKLIIKNLVNYETNSYLSHLSQLSYSFYLTKLMHKAASGYRYLQKTFPMRCMVRQVITRINLKEDLQPMVKFLAEQKMTGACNVLPLGTWIKVTNCTMAVL